MPSPSYKSEWHSSGFRPHNNTYLQAESEASQTDRKSCLVDRRDHKFSQFHHRLRFSDRCIIHSVIVSHLLLLLPSAHRVCRGFCMLPHPLVSSKTSSISESDSQDNSILSSSLFCQIHIVFLFLLRSSTFYMYNLHITSREKSNKQHHSSLAL